jgi:hypothetical protein
MAEDPELFRLTNPLRDTDARLPSFSTPLGRLLLELEVAGLPIPPTATFTVGDRSVTVWAAPVRFEVLLAPAPIALPSGMAVAGAWAAVWRIGNAEPDRPLVLKCLWAGTVGWTDVGPESGENLEAQTWTDRRTRVTVGLPDYQTAITYRRDGFEVAVGSVPGGQGHFLCAWGPDMPDDISTWFAVDWPTTQLVPAEVEPPATADRGGL